jgi:predicted adenylyl cyclase CyaB
MQEVECKILNVNQTKAERMLKGLGAVKKGTHKLRSMHFDTQKKDFQRNGWLLRLRTDGKEHVLTMKTNITKSSGIKSADEKEILVSDFGLAKTALEDMGFIVVRQFVKTRTTYALGKAKIEIDKYGRELSFIPTFMEIEATSKSAVLIIARKLGYTAKDLKPWTVYELIDYYKGRKL